MSRYDGLSKWWTADCAECPYRSEDLCYWGAAIKRLSVSYPDGTERKARRCEFRWRLPGPESAWRFRFMKGVR